MFGHMRVVKEAVGRLRRRPVAAGRQDSLARRRRHLIQQASQPTGQTLVAKGRRRKLFLLSSGFAAAGLVTHP